MKNTSMLVVLLGLLCSCGVPLAKLEKLPRVATDFSLVTFGGEVFLGSPSSIVRLEGSAWVSELKVPARLFTDGDELWARTSDGLLRRTGAGIWSAIDDLPVPAAELVAALPGTDAWLATHTRLFHQVEGAWVEVPLAYPEGVIYDLTRAAHTVWASTGDGIGNDTVLRFDGPEWAPFTVNGMNAHLRCGEALCWTDAKQVAQVADASKRFDVPAEHVSYGTPAIPTAIAGVHDSVLWLDQWQGGGGSSLTGAGYNVTAQVSRLEGSSWVPAFQLTSYIWGLIEVERGLFIVHAGLDAYRIDTR